MSQPPMEFPTSSLTFLINAKTRSDNRGGRPYHQQDYQHKKRTTLQTPIERTSHTTYLNVLATHYILEHRHQSITYT